MAGGGPIAAAKWRSIVSGAGPAGPFAGVVAHGALAGASRPLERSPAEPGAPRRPAELPTGGG